MAEKVTLESKIDDKPIPNELKTKVPDALKTSLAAELKLPGFAPSHHFSVTHFSIVSDQA